MTGQGKKSGQYGGVGEIPKPVDYSEKKVLDDLYRVGPDKPMGSFQTLKTKRCKVNVTELRTYLESIGIKTVLYGETGCIRYSGGLLSNKETVYAYDEEALQKLIDENKSVLEKYDWPTDAASFVKMSHYSVCEIKPVRRVLCLAFDDKDTLSRLEKIDS